MLTHNIVIRSDSLSAGITTSRRLDSMDYQVFTEDLIAYDPKTFDYLKTPLSSFARFPQATIDKTATVYQYNMGDSTGTAAYKGVKAGKATDVPFVNYAEQKYLQKLEDIVIAYCYCDADVAISERVARLNIINKLSSQAQRAMAEIMNKTCFLGNTAVGLPGLLSTANKALLQSYTITKDWVLTTTTANDIMTDLTTAYTNYLDVTKGNILPDTLLLSPKLYAKTKLAILNNFSNAPVGEVFSTMNNISIHMTPELAPSWLGGSYKETAILYKRDSDYIEHIVADYYTPRPPQAVGYEYRVYCSSRHGGIVIRMPKSIMVISNLS
jgi:hypothetical protein